MSRCIDQAQFDHVLTAYDCQVDKTQVSPLGNGLINNTFLVSSPGTKFVLQRINHNVFKQPKQVVNNADLINEHLQNKKEAQEYSLEPMWQLKDKSGKPSVKYNEHLWRAIQFIPNCYTIEEVDSAKQAHMVAKAFGEFTSALSDFPATELDEIIKDFHNLEFRMSQLADAVSQDKYGRLHQCKDIVDLCFKQHKFIDEVATYVDVLPVQVTHNDTKINNLLFANSTKKPIAVIDLDTCMPGFIMHDFGDMVRTCCSNLAEDGTALNEMALRLDIFEGLATGYVESFSGKMTTVEKDSLVIGAQLLPFMIGVRFLTDFIDGDNYFHTQRDTHNLDRAKNQINLFGLLKKSRSELEAIVANA